MRILYIAHTFGSWATDDTIWERNLRQTLIEMGHKVLHPGYDQNVVHIACSSDTTGEARAKSSDQFVTAVKQVLKKSGIDLLFTYFDNRHVLPEAIREVRRVGVLTVNFFCNAAYQFDQVAEVAPAFDYCMVPERDALAKYVAVGARPVHIPMAANSTFYHPLDAEEQYDLVFVGGNYSNREEYLSHLWRKGIDVHVFGNGWDTDMNALPKDGPWRPRLRKVAGIAKRKIKRRYGIFMGKRLPPSCCEGPVSDKTLVELCSSARITLGLSEFLMPDGQVIRYVRLRDFEAPMCGACYITNFQPELEEYYVIGKEIVCYEARHDLLEKVRFYLDHPTERRRIRENGRRRALAEHTWQHRFVKLFTKIGL
jgi:glycosyltransferase involved in cell wall biosynthesis